VVNPLPQLDDWAVLANGTVAIVRGIDYHVDWIDPDDTRRSTARLPFDWRRLGDDDKHALVDSARGANAAKMATGVNAAAATDEVNSGRTARAGADKAGAVTGTKSDGAGAGAGKTVVAEPTYVALDEIPDYYPPIRAGALRADADGNLWILPTTSAHQDGGKLVYDVVSSNGELIERVRMPVGRSIAGFGPGGVVYLMSRDSGGGWALERTRVVRDRGRIAQ
jgi:hypothetical protein